MGLDYGDQWLNWQFEVWHFETKGISDKMFENDIVKNLFKRQYSQKSKACGFNLNEKQILSSRYIPNSSVIVQKYKHKAFCSILNSTGEKLLSTAQDDTIRQYDLTKLRQPYYPKKPNASQSNSDKFSKSPISERECRYARRQHLQLTSNDENNYGERLHFTSPNAIIEYQGQDVGWSILDVAYSPDGNKFVYSSWSRYVHECDVDLAAEPRHGIQNLNSNNSDTEQYLDNSYSHSRYHHRPLSFNAEDEPRFCLFSLAYSPDGNEIIGGATDGRIHIYDRELNKTIQRIPCHEDDVNGVTFANNTSDILISGGDDGLIKVWDRRNLKEESPRPVGVWAGHGHGITYIHSKGDGRYAISNSKDQSIKLWDTRKFSSLSGQEETLKAVGRQNWDYRWERVPNSVKQLKNMEGDSSVQTYRGHMVLYTLIRCRFSPAFTTDQQYIATGCATGDIIVYNVLTGAIETTLKGHLDCVRDVTWHPYKLELYSASWDGSVRYWNYCAEADKAKA